MVKVESKLKLVYLIGPILSLTICNCIRPGETTFNSTAALLQSNPYLAQQLLEEFASFTEGVQGALGVANLKTRIGEEIKSEVNGRIKYPIHSSRSGSGGLETEGRTVNSDVNKNGNLNSVIGVTSVLGVVHENIWYALRLPAEAFSTAVRSAPASLSGLMGTLFKASETEYNTKIRNLIFTPTFIKTTMNLIHLKSEVKQVYFESPEKAMESINHVISTRYGGAFNLPDYLTEPLPNTTESLIINAKEQRGIWPDTANYVGSFYQYKSSPSGVRSSRSGTWSEPETEVADMFDIFGTFQFGQNEQFQFVTVPFQNTKLVLTLIIPHEGETDINLTPEQLDKINLPSFSSCHMRIRLPIRTFVSRNTVKVSNSTDECKGSSNVYKGHCLEFLDTLTYTSFSPAQFQTITITGGVVANSYASFLKSASSSHMKNKFHGNPLRRHSQNLDPWRLSPPKKSIYSRNSHPISFPKYWQWRSSFFPTHNRFASSSNQHLRNSNNRLYTLDNLEKLVVFDRPFYWFVQGAL